MGKITVHIDDDIEQRFRKMAQKEHGAKKGWFGRAATEALDVWARKKIN